MTSTYLFYDLETSGLSPYFDQILTFAAIRTDFDLNEIERYELTLNLRPDIVPSPGAFITHRLTMDELKKGISEYDAACTIHEIVNTPGTISLGYNTLGFDDAFLRFMFYRNLLDPYKHQYADGCRRMDILPIATLYRVFKPDVIHWPEVRGNPSMKLELISELNALVSGGRAHEAMTDVEATLALARHLKKEEKMWAYCLGFFDKKEDRARQDKLPSDFQGADKKYKLGLMVSLEMGKELSYVAPVVKIGESIPYSNQSLWLRLDKEILPESDELNLEEQFVIRKKYGEPAFFLPPLNRFWERLPMAQRNSQQNGIRNNQERINRNAESQAVFNNLVKYHQQFQYPFVPNVDIDAALYQTSFFSIAEKKDISRFHRGELSDQISLIDSETCAPRVRNIGARILFRNHRSHELSSKILSQKRVYWNQMMGKNNDSGQAESNTTSVLGYKNDHRLTPEKALEEIKMLYKSENGSQQKIQGVTGRMMGEENSEKYPTLDNEQKAILEELKIHIESMRDQ